MSQPEFEIESADAVARLRALPPEDSPMHPDAVAFAHFLADTLDRPDRPAIDPSNMVTVLLWAAADIRRGYDVNGQPIESPLRDLHAESLLALAPTIARAAFSGMFGDQLENNLLENDILPYIEIDPITEPITDMATAKAKIFDAALKELMRLDWGNFEVNTKDVRELFLQLAALVVKDPAYILPIDLYDNDIPQERSVIQEALDEQKLELVPNQWLLFTRQPVMPEDAYAARATVALKVVDGLSGLFGLDPKDLAGHFAGPQMDTPFAKMLKRYVGWALNHPELKRPDALDQE